MFIENIIGSKAKVKILRVLSEVRTAYTLKGLVDETALSLSIIHKASEELVEENILTKIKGNRKECLYKFNSETGFASALFELFKIEKTKQRGDVIFLKTWSILELILTKIKDNINLMILFGSQVRGEATLNSDIDLLIIPKCKSSKFLEVIKRVDEKINPMFLDIKTFKSDIKNKTPFYNSIKKEGVIIFIRKKFKDEIKDFLEDIRPL